MDNTAQHFWQMVWEQEVEVIAMLTKLMVSGETSGAYIALWESIPLTLLPLSASRNMVDPSAFDTGLNPEGQSLLSNLAM